MSSERRQHERLEVLAQVELRRGGTVETLATINISAGGLLLRNDGDFPYEVGEAIRVHFNAPDLATPFALDATIVRVIAATAKPALLAAMWTSSDAAATQSLSQLLWSLKQT
jgi:hypothetical protein